MCLCDCKSENESGVKCASVREKWLYVRESECGESKYVWIVN